MLTRTETSHPKLGEIHLGQSFLPGFNRPRGSHVVCDHVKGMEEPVKLRRPVGRWNSNLTLT